MSRPSPSTAVHPRSLARRCAHAFRPRDKSLGEEYFLDGRVRLGTTAGGRAEAIVQGADTFPYRARVDWGDAAASYALAVSCECPFFARGQLCKHLWATLLALDETGAFREVPGSSRLLLLPAHEGDPALGGEGEGEEGDEGESWHSPPPDPGAAWRRQLDSIAREIGRGADERRRLAPPRRLELWPQIDREATRRTGRLTLRLFQREERRTGGMGALRPLELDEATLAELSDPADREAAKILLGLGLGRRSAIGEALAPDAPAPAAIGAVEVPGGLYPIVLPRLAATGRLGWWEGGGDRPDPERRLAWDDGEPWRFVLRLEPAGDGAAIRGRLVRGEAVASSGATGDELGESVDVARPLLLLSEGLVLFRERLARLDAAGAFSWIATLRRRGPIPVPADDVPQVLAELGELPTLPPLDVAPELDVPADRPAPVPVLVLEDLGGAGGGDDDSVRAELHFAYGGRRVGAWERRPVLVESARLLHRDPAAEAAARRLLVEELEALAAPGDRAFFLPPAGLLETIDRLLGDGWRIEADEAPLARPDRLELSVASGIDWFDLSGELGFAGGKVALPRLLSALEEGAQTVELDDGSRGVLPVGWFERFAALARASAPADADATGDAGEEADALRFQPSQALLLDALLEALPGLGRGEGEGVGAGGIAVERRVDHGFARLRDRLRSGRDVAPAEEPEGFDGTLRPYQKVGVGWLGFLAEVGLGGCLADDMGLGKTIQVLAHLLARKNADRAAGRPRRTSLVVAPRSVVYNWLDEAARFTPDLATLDYTGTQRSALLGSFGEHDLVITTYGTLRRDAAELAARRFDHVILDEAQAIKNAASQTAKAARLLRADHRLALTGTPVENRLAELGSLFEFLNPGMLGRSSLFAGLAAARRPDGTDEDGLGDLARALGPFILRRTKAEVLPELPPKTEQTLVVSLGERQRALYDELRDHYRARLAERIEKEGLGRSRIQVLEALLRLRQAAIHPGLIDPERADGPSAKLAALREQLDEVLDEGHKALVFSQFTSFLALLRRGLDRDGVRYEYLDGKTRDRAERVERFQSDPDCRLFLISLKAGGTGLNLTAADYVFLLDPWWNPAVEAQAIDRAHRIGQERPVIAYRLIARDTVEEKILELQKSKRALADAVLAESGGALADLSAEDLELLLS